MADPDEGRVRRCDFCRQPLSAGAVELEYDGDPYECCSRACRDAMVESDRVFTEFHGHRRLRTGVAGIDDSLPRGLPRNSMVLLVGQSGTREESILAELVWRALRRDEPAVVVSFTEPPTSVVETFLELEWNVLPYLESGRLRVLDCFTSRIEDDDRLFDRMSDWNRHLARVVDPATTPVRDPTDGHELRNKLDNCLEDLGMVESGVVAIDSLAEFGSLVQPVRAYGFVRDVRADVCKGRFVPVFAGGLGAPERTAFPRDLDHVVDGVIDLRLDDRLLADTLFRRLRVRKMRCALAISEWHTYEYTSGLGLVTFDPREEMDDDERREPRRRRPPREPNRGADPADAPRPEADAPRPEAGDSRPATGDSRPDSPREPPEG